MIYIKLPERLKYSSPQEKRKYITSDEIWAFTEHPHTEKPGKENSLTTPHELFNLFTAEIIQANTDFIR